MSSDMGREEIFPIRINLILLAAGKSVRFHGNKLLADVHGKPLYRVTLLCLQECSIRLQSEGIQALVTVIAANQEIRDDCRKHGIPYVQNSGLQNTGIASTIQTGILFCESQEKEEQELKQKASCGMPAGNTMAVYDMFFPADQPLLDPELLVRFVLAFTKQDRKIGAMSYHGTPRSPNIFSACYRGELKRLSGDTGGKAVINRHSEDVFIYPVKQETMFWDVDTRYDYEKMRSYQSLINNKNRKM